MIPRNSSRRPRTARLGNGVAHVALVLLVATAASLVLAPNVDGQASAPVYVDANTAAARARLARDAYDGLLEAPVEAFDDAAHAAWIATLPPDLRHDVVELDARAFLVERRAWPASLAGSVGPRTLYAQFVTDPTDAERRALRRSGVVVHRHVTNRTYLVTAERGALAPAFDAGLLLGTAEARPLDRVAANVAAGAYVAPVEPVRPGTRGVEVTPGSDGARPSRPARFRATVTFRDDERLPASLDEARARLAPFVESIETTTWQPCAGVASVRVTLRADALLPLLAAEPSIEYVDDAGFVRETTTNDVAATVSNVRTVNNAGFLGAGRRLAMIDSGKPRVFHQEFRPGLITAVDANPAEDHTTHVAGTLCGLGVQARARGMADGLLELRVYDWDNFWTDLDDAGSAGCDGVNNSWGSTLGWDRSGSTWVNTGSHGFFGDYNSDSENIDARAYAFDGMQITWAAGNDRDDGPSASQHDGNAVAWQGTGTAPSNLYADTIDPHACAKNALTVGAVTIGKALTSFSSAGPADDGRIKPELCAVGFGVYSPIANTTSSYTFMDGTSMSTPVVTGAVALLAEVYESVFGAPVRSDALRAALVHTAEDLFADQGYVGPDMWTGHGLLDAGAAYALLASGASRNLTGSVASASSVVDVATIAVAPGEPFVEATLSWTDPPGTAGAIKAQRNDLDLVLVDPAGRELASVWKLQKADPSAVAIRERNDVDTTEKARIDAPAAGNWRVRVRGFRVPVAPQRFALVTDRPANARSMTLDAPLRVGLTSTATVRGNPGDLYAVAISTALLGAPQQVSGWLGDWWLANFQVLGVGNVGAQGLASASVPVPAQTALAGLAVYMQGVSGDELTPRTDLVIEP